MALIHICLTGYPAAAWRCIIRSGIALGIYPAAVFAVCRGCVAVLALCASAASCTLACVGMVFPLTHSQYLLTSSGDRLNCRSDRSCNVQWSGRWRAKEEWHRIDIPSNGFVSFLDDGAGTIGNFNDILLEEDVTAVGGELA